MQNYIVFSYTELRLYEPEEIDQICNNMPGHALYEFLLSLDGAKPVQTFFSPWCVIVEREYAQYPQHPCNYCTYATTHGICSYVGSTYSNIILQLKKTGHLYISELKEIQDINHITALKVKLTMLKED